MLDSTVSKPKVWNNSSLLGLHVCGIAVWMDPGLSYPTHSNVSHSIRPLAAVPIEINVLWFLQRPHTQHNDGKRENTTAGHRRKGE